MSLKISSRLTNFKDSKNGFKYPAAYKCKISGRIVIADKNKDNDKVRCMTISLPYLPSNDYVGEYFSITNSSFEAFYSRIESKIILNFN